MTTEETPRESREKAFERLLSQDRPRKGCVIADGYSHTVVEQDPSGLAPGDPGAKLDAGKVMAGLLLDFGPALLAVAEVSTVGAKKYSRGGWSKVDDGYNRYTDAMMRHLLAEGEYDDGPGGTGLLHDAQVAWNALARLYFKLVVERVPLRDPRRGPAEITSAQIAKMLIREDQKTMTEAILSGPGAIPPQCSSCEDRSIFPHDTDGKYSCQASDCPSPKALLCPEHGCRSDCPRLKDPEQASPEERPKA